MKKNRYYIALTFWSMGEKYWSLTQGVCDRITRNQNLSFLISDQPITGREFEKRTKWNDVNMVIPLLFNFYHGLELILKGFILFAEGNSAKLNHGITQLHFKFIEYYPGQKKLNKFFARYLVKSHLPEILREFLDHNRLSVNRFYESLRYPFNLNLSREYQHFVLKYKGGNGIQFYRVMSKDIREMMRLVVALGRSLG
jgi:hypothetical protein